MSNKTHSYSTEEQYFIHVIWLFTITFTTQS